MSDEQDRAEELDPDELGDDPEGDLTFPAEGYLGSTDPTRDDLVTDSVASRDWRDDIGDDPRDAVRLSGPNDETELIGDAQDVDDASAEEAAIHITSDDA